MGRLARPIPVRGAGAVSAHGSAWRGLDRVVRDSAREATPSSELANSHPGTCSFEVKALPEPGTVAEKRARLLMSRSAVLASAATEAALRDAGWETPLEGGLEDVGFYLGVGASGGSVEQLRAMLAASVADREFSLPRFGDQGLRACNPLFAFQLMNNFTLCHSAIRHGTQGPNAAFFSRGTGTVFALLEAAHTLLAGECRRALVGGADSSVHPVTWAELVREGFAARGLVPGEGASVLALGDPAEPRGAVGFVERVSVLACRTRTLARALDGTEEDLDFSTVDAVVLAPWGPPARDPLLSFAVEALDGRPASETIWDVSRVFGESLAASPALAWAVALGLLADERLAQRISRVLILSAGLDGDVGLVVMRREATT